MNETTQSPARFIPSMLVSTVASGLLLLIVGCAGEPAPLRFVTFDTSLAYGEIDAVDARVDPIIDAVVAEEADVVCLQGLWPQPYMAGWSNGVIEDVLSRTAEAYPYSYWHRTHVPHDAPVSGCERAESEALEACAAPACSAASPDELADCILTSCGAELTAASGTCQTCLFANLGRSYDELVAACQGVTRGGIAHDGHNGLAILSRHPISETEHLALSATYVARSVLRATVETDRGPVDVYCTELQSDRSALVQYPEDSLYTSFEDENMGQTEDVLAWVDRTATSPVRALMGSFDHGPGGEAIEEVLPHSYDRVMTAGYLDPISDPPVGCTWCSNNRLIDDASSSDVLIDHIYLDAMSASGATAEVLFDAPIDVVGKDGEPRTVHLSDHYAVGVTF